MDPTLSTLLAVLFGGVISALTTAFANWQAAKRDREQWARQQEAEKEKWGRELKAETEKWEREQKATDDRLLRDRLIEIYGNAAKYCGLKDIGPPEHGEGIGPDKYEQQLVEFEKQNREAKLERFKWLALLLAHFPENSPVPLDEFQDWAQSDFVSADQILEIAASDKRLMG